MAKYLTIEEVAKMLRCSTFAIYLYIRNKGMPAYKVGHAYKFVEEEVDTWVKQTRKHPNADGKPLSE